MSDRECPCLAARSGTYRARPTGGGETGLLGGLDRFAVQPGARPTRLKRRVGTARKGHVS